MKAENETTKSTNEMMQEIHADGLPVSTEIEGPTPKDDDCDNLTDNYDESPLIWSADLHDDGEYENNCDDRPSLRQLRGNFW